MKVSSELEMEFHRIGDTLRSAYGLVGLFGVDVILNGNQLWVLEVNPRYTASVEVLERAFGIYAVEFHIAACRGKNVLVKPLNRSALQFGKAICFANEPTIVNRFFLEWISGHHPPSDGWMVMADIPEEGTRIAAGRPVMTVFASAPTAEQVRGRLAQRIAETRQALARNGSQAAQPPLYRP